VTQPDRRGTPVICRRAFSRARGRPSGMWAKHGLMGATRPLACGGAAGECSKAYQSGGFSVISNFCGCLGKQGGKVPPYPRGPRIVRITSSTWRAKRARTLGWQRLCVPDSSFWRYSLKDIGASPISSSLGPHWALAGYRKSGQKIAPAFRRPKRVRIRSEFPVYGRPARPTRTTFAGCTFQILQTVRAKNGPSPSSVSNSLYPTGSHPCGTQRSAIM